MTEKLNINIEKLKKKSKLFNSNRFKALFGATLIAATLTSCNTNTNYSADSQNNTSYTQEENSYYPINITFDNYNQEIIDEEVITLLNSNNEITQAILIDRDGEINSAINSQNTKIHSKYIGKTIDIPRINEDEKLNINFDYNTKDITISIQNKDVMTK